MKTSIYNKRPHTTGFDGQDEKAAKKSDVQQAYEAGNDTQEVTSYGKMPIAEQNKFEHEHPVTARDGYDNTGTQGADSLSDDTYNSQNRQNKEKGESQTGSKSNDFK